jgi:hypothetical protein
LTRAKDRLISVHPQHEGKPDSRRTELDAKASPPHCCPAKPFRRAAFVAGPRQRGKPDKVMKTKAFALVLVSSWLLAGCAKTPGDLYVHQQTNMAQAGNRWAQFNLWDAYHHGTHGVDKNPAKADKWLGQFVKDVYVARFEPANGFNPKNAGDYLKNISKRAPAVRSDNDRLGVAGFFRTKKEGDKLVASFLTNEPDKLQAFIENNPDLKFISVEAMTPQSFIEYEQSIQESL